MTRPTERRGNKTDHKLTPIQQNILDYFRTAQERGNWPTHREVGDAVGLKSTSSVAYHLQRLHDLGYLHRTRSTPRSYGLTDNRTGEMQRLPSLDQPAVALKELIEFSRACADLGATPEAVEEFEQASRGLMKSVFSSLAAQADASAQGFTDA
ncbi:LexA family protein [Streptomyces sp. CMB-StM0423]|uniref:LexA family protein n=1 Tax=Streptomyces sp. CMB-StM0423 TaxID=2059884 RepID=UPI000C713E5D|nr:hypothetical protein [Streptomyces sp. CMB-StM0423]AUH40465.1 hypothetical protein CXR04_09540 [Streptomyces sp. CMB-StM0423]